MSRVFELDHVIVKHYLGILRNRDTDTAQFREALGNLGLFLAIEMTKGLATHPIAVETPLMTTRSEEIRERIAIVPVLRAGLALVDPFRKLLPDVSVLHLGMYRDEETAKPVAYYNKLESAPVVDSAIIVDPMLATGGSAPSVTLRLLFYFFFRVNARAEGQASLHVENARGDDRASLHVENGRDDGRASLHVENA